MRPDDRRDGMESPLILGRFINLVESAPTGRTAIRMAGVVFMPAAADAAAGVHGDGCVSAIHPQLHPMMKGGSPAAMHQHHGWNLFAWLGCRDAVIRKDTGRLAFPWGTFEEDRLHAFNAMLRSRVNARHLGQKIHVP